VLQQPLGDQHHDDALAAALGVPDDAAFAPGDALLCGLHAEELVRPRHLLLAGVEDDDVADQVEQPGLVAELRQRPVKQRSLLRASASPREILVLPLHEELFRRAGGAVAQSLRVAARQYELHGAEEALVEDLFLIGDKLPYTVSQFHGAAFELHHRDGEAVNVEHEVRLALVAALQRHLVSQREIVLLRVLPVDQVHRLMCLACGNLHRHAVAQELIGAQVGLVERDAGRVGGSIELLQRGGDVGGRVAARGEIAAEERRLDAAVVIPLVPFAEVAVAEVAGSRRVGKQGDDAVLRFALGAGLLRHGNPLWDGSRGGAETRRWGDC